MKDIVRQLRKASNEVTAFGANQQLCADAAAEIKKLRDVLADIRDAKEPKDDPAPDDADWRFVALEMKRVAEIALRNVKRTLDR